MIAMCATKRGFCLPLWCGIFCGTVAFADDLAESAFLGTLEERLNAMLPSAPGGGFPEGMFERFSAAPRAASAWSDQPRCDGRAGRIVNCRFNHKNGHGLFAVGERDKFSSPNFLVCASTAGQRQGYLDQSEIISSRCLVSSLNWEYGSGRSDFRGVFDWLEQRAPQDAAQIPSLLAEQCVSTFPEAAHCSPTLLVLPASRAGVLDVCALHTRRASFNLLLLQVHQGNSRWKCERKDLAVPDRQERLPVAEWNCVADAWGFVDPLCSLPYIPTTEPLRVRRDDHPVGPYPAE